MYHYPPKHFKEGKNSVGYYSFNQARKLVIFVHGFTGHALDTWNQFPKIVKEDINFKNVDVLFYGYDSLTGHAVDYSIDFYDFLQKYSTTVPNNIRPEFRVEYEKILIVAHSLGAIVARQALITSIKANAPWRRKCRLLLFAPAHNGASLKNLVLGNIEGFLKIIGAYALYKFPIIHDLDPNSPSIKTLKEDTILFEGTPEEPILKAIVCFAHGDKVVHNANFCYDHVPAFKITGPSHMSVCKPINPSFQKPLEILINAL